MLSSRVVLRAPRPNEPDGWHVADHTRLIGQDYPTIQQMIEVKHREYPGPTVIEANSIGLPVIQNLSIHPDELIEQRTTQSSKHAMLTELEMLLQPADPEDPPVLPTAPRGACQYRLPDSSIAQDSVMALGFAIAHRRRAHDKAAGGRINRRILRDLNSDGYASWLDERDARLPPTRADRYSANDKTAVDVVAAGGGMAAIIDATGLRTQENVIRLIDPATLERARQNEL